VGLAVVAVVLGGLAWALFARAEEGPPTLQTADFSFSYPAEWERIEGVEFPLAEREGRDEVGDNTVGVDLENWVTVVRAEIPISIDERNVGELIPDARRLWQRAAESSPPARVLAEPYVTRVGELPAVRLRIRGESPRGRIVEDQLTLLYDGKVSYAVTCQSEPDREVDIAAGCEQVLESLRPRG
jgi:hypothetical protein